jgi:crotonobetainyl-CoA:carnitine CoA-transferase CaiB-like acyl-CoA transferase
MNYLALAGVLSMCGEPAGPPMPLPVPFADYIGALYGAIGVISALVRHGCRNGPRTLDNGFVRIDASIFESALSLLHYYNSNPMTGRPDFEKGEDVLSGWHPFYRLFKCRDGKYLSLGAIEQKFWDNLLDAIGHPELKTEQFSGNVYVVDELRLKPAVDAAEITELLETIFLEKDRDDWVTFLAAHDVCCTPVNDLSETWADEQVQARGMLVEVADPRYGPKRHIEFPVKIDGERPPISPAPDPGQDNAEILGALEIDAEQLLRLKKKHVV